jgi:hypothetical protein
MTHLKIQHTVHLKIDCSKCSSTNPLPHTLLPHPLCHTPFVCHQVWTIKLPPAARALRIHALLSRTALMRSGEQAMAQLRTKEVVHGRTTPPTRWIPKLFVNVCSKSGRLSRSKQRPHSCVLRVVLEGDLAEVIQVPVPPPAWMCVLTLSLPPLSTFTALLAQSLLSSLWLTRPPRNHTSTPTHWHLSRRMGPRPDRTPT